VEITNEQERLRAIEILQNSGEEIYDGSCLFSKSSDGYLRFDEVWKLLSCPDETKITLDELEAFLTPNVNSFCKTPQEKCTLNYCDENGCMNRKRTTAEISIPIEQPKKSNVFTDVQEWIRENLPNVTYTFQGKETPDCFKRLEQHLRNDYPQGTEIKISKDKIEIYHS